LAHGLSRHPIAGASSRPAAPKSPGGKDTGNHPLHSVSYSKVVRPNPSQGRSDRHATLSVSPLAKEDGVPDNNSVTVNTRVAPAQQTLSPRRVRLIAH